MPFGRGRCVTNALCSSATPNRYVQREAQPVRHLYALPHLPRSVHCHVHRATELDLAGGAGRSGRRGLHFRFGVLAQHGPAATGGTFAADSRRDSTAALKIEQLPLGVCLYRAHPCMIRRGTRGTGRRAQFYLRHFYERRLCGYFWCCPRTTIFSCEIRKAKC